MTTEETKAQESAKKPTTKVKAVDPTALKIQRGLGAYLCLLALLLLYSVYALWPRSIEQPATTDPPRAAVEQEVPDAAEPAAARPDGADEPEGPAEEGESKCELQVEWNRDSEIFGQTWRIADPVRILLLVILLGALGSVVGASSSLVHFVGNKAFEPSWTLWYYLRPVIGSILALIFYLVVRAGFDESFNYECLDEHLRGAAAIAALTGMFSKLTADKLEDIFSTVLQSNKDKQRANKSGENEDHPDEPEESSAEA